MTPFNSAMYFSAAYDACYAMGYDPYENLGNNIMRWEYIARSMYDMVILTEMMKKHNLIPK